jgi:hypothetical protein
MLSSSETVVEHIATAERCITVFKSSSSDEDKVTALNEFALLLERAEGAYLELNIPEWQNRYTKLIVAFVR